MHQEGAAFVFRLPARGKARGSCLINVASEHGRWTVVPYEEELVRLLNYVNFLIGNKLEYWWEEGGEA